MATGAAADTATSWLAELDRINLSWNTTDFIHNHLGRLPVELLESIVRYTPACYLPAVARISSRFRELAEKRPYSCIDLGDKRTMVWKLCKDVLWPLHCTLVHRPDMAQKVRGFSCTFYDQEVNVRVDNSTLFPGDIYFCSAAKVSLDQLVIRGRVLSQHLTNVEILHLTLSLVGSEMSVYVEATTCKHLAPEPLSKLMPGFDNTSAHRLFPGLQKLTNLDYAGAVPLGTCQTAMPPEAKPDAPMRYPT